MKVGSDGIITMPLKDHSCTFSSNNSSLSNLDKLLELKINQPFIYPSPYIFLTNKIAISILRT